MRLWMWTGILAPFDVAGHVYYLLGGAEMAGKVEDGERCVSKARAAAGRRRREAGLRMIHESHDVVKAGRGSAVKDRWPVPGFLGRASTPRTQI